MFVKIGTPIRDQPVVLQGAFEGARVAGYHNTVGSAEGWKPTQFVSSRTKRAVYISRPEDYMDQHDMKRPTVSKTLDYDVSGHARKLLEKGSTFALHDFITQPIGLQLLAQLGSKNFGFSNSVILPKTDECGLGFTAPRIIPKASVSTGIFEEDDDLSVYENYSHDYDTVIHDEAPEKKDIQIKGVVAGFVPSKTKIPNIPEFPVPLAPKDYKPSASPAAIAPRQSIAPSSNLLAVVQKTRELATQNRLPETKDLPKISPEDAKAALAGFLPFADDFEKQKRYINYLKVMIGEEKNIIAVPKSFSAEDAMHEPHEFFKAALIYKPLSKMMSDRFSSDIISTVPEKPVTLVYGSDTRTYHKWKPARITCKRFGVGYVAGDSDEDSEPDKEVLNKQTMEALKTERDRILGVERTDEKSDAESLDGQQDVDFEQIPQMEIEKPSMDLFKAIFLDSDEEQDNAKEDNALRPVFSKPKIAPKNEVTKLKKRGVQLDSIESFSEEIVVTKKPRPSAADFM
jgi:hypothetical protein